MSKNNYGVQFLSPLVESGKITGLNDQTARPFLNDIAKPFYNNSPVYQQLASFIGNQLAMQPNFKTVNILDTDGAGEYKPDSQTLNISSQSFPIRTFIHEGTHGLDNRDPQKRSYQNEAIDFLAKRLGNRPITEDKGSWYENARKILKNNTFKGKNYKFGNFKVNKNNVQNGIPYGEDFSGGILQEGQELLGSPNPNLSYSDIQNRLNQIRPQLSPRPFYSFSEFPAFAVESLINPWNIKPQNDDFYNKKNMLETADKEHGQNLGRKFLKSMVKATYRNFQDLHNQQQQTLPENKRTTFAGAYPNANQAFLDRLSQLRNYSKYPNTEDGKNNFLAKMQQTSALGYQPVVSSSNIANPLPLINTSSSSSLGNLGGPLVQSIQPTMNRQNLDRPESPWQQNPRLSSRNPLLQELEQYGSPPSSPDYQNPAHARYFVNQHGTNQQNTERNRYQPY